MTLSPDENLSSLWSQGSGKSTQLSSWLTNSIFFDLCGQISRDLAKEPTPLAKGKKCIEVGEPTPNEIIVPAVNALLAKNSLAEFCF